MCNRAGLDGLDVRECWIINLHVYVCMGMYVCVYVYVGMLCVFEVVCKSRLCVAGLAWMGSMCLVCVYTCIRVCRHDVCMYYVRVLNSY